MNPLNKASLHIIYTCYLSLGYNTTRLEAQFDRSTIRLEAVGFLTVCKKTRHLLPLQKKRGSVVHRPFLNVQSIFGVK